MRIKIKPEIIPKNTNPLSSPFVVANKKQKVMGAQIVKYNISSTKTKISEELPIFLIARKMSYKTQKITPKPTERKKAKS